MISKVYKYSRAFVANGNEAFGGKSKKSGKSKEEGTRVNRADHRSVTASGTLMPHLLGVSAGVVGHWLQKGPMIQVT
jgi:hypothetical protein